MSKKVVYIKDDCPYSTKLLEKLEQENENYLVVNVSQDTESLKYIKDQYKADKVPVLVEGDRVTTGDQDGMG